MEHCPLVCVLFLFNQGREKLHIMTNWELETMPKISRINENPSLVLIISLLLLVSTQTTATARNPKAVPNTKSAFPAIQLDLDEIWRRGGSDDEEVMIGLPVEALADNQGRVYLADQQLCQIFVFSPNGKLIKTLSREGEGPGEVRGPVDMVRLPDGTIGLAEFFPGKIIKMTYEDVSAGEITVDVSAGQTGGFTMQTMAESQGEHLVIAGSRTVPEDKFSERTHFLAAVDQQGRETVRYMEQVSRIQRPHSVVHENDFLPSFPLASALGPDGRVYTPADRNHYAINVFLADGTLDKVIKRPDFKTWKRNKLDKQRIESLFQSWAGANPDTWPEFDLKKTERAINTLHVDGQGRLWVQHSRSNRDLPEGVFLSLDLYDPQGHWLREVQLKCEGNPVSDGIRFLRDGRILLIRGFVVARLACLGSGTATLGEDDTESIEIICYKLPEF
jgi:6-bladed beta-propeller